MSRIASWTLEGVGGQVIYGDTHAPAKADASAVLVICHGFKGYKDYGFFPQLAQRAADAGLLAHRFNFSHSGMTNRIETFERPDLFEADTWSKQVEDLTKVIRLRGEGTHLPIVVFGHSRGGVTALLTCAKLDSQYLAGVVTAAAPAEACSLDEQQRAMLRKAGRMGSPSSRTGQELYVGKTWLEEIEADPQAFDPCRAIGRIDAAKLVIHGEADETVPVSAAHRLAEAGGAELAVIAGAGHTFGAPNPLAIEADPPPTTERLYEAVIGFVERVVSA